MKIQFATCCRKTALQFLKKLYPSSAVEDSPESAGPVLDLVEKDVFRIPDPYMHGGRVGIYPSKNFDESKKDEYIKILKEFHDKHSKGD